MPRVSRQKAARRHASAVQLPSKRSFAVADSQVAETLVPGPSSTVFDHGAGPSRPIKGKAERQLKPPPGRQSTGVALDLPSHPYSRSHLRREKRKAKANLAGGQLHDVAAALSESLGESTKDVRARIRTGREREEEKRKAEEKAKIGAGAGRSRTLREKSRRKAIALEGRRLPAVRSHPAFQSNPWETIRLHAANSLATKEVPKSR